jgi:hypothetical protein
MSFSAAILLYISYYSSEGADQYTSGDKQQQQHDNCNRNKNNKAESNNKKPLNNKNKRAVIARK